MKSATRKIPRGNCFVAAILSELDNRLKTHASQKEANSEEAILAYQKLLEARRTHANHAARCALCQRAQSEAA